MRKLSILYKIELKIVLRQLDSIIFGIIFPAALSIILGFIFKDKPAYEGASYTFLEQSFGALAVIGVCATGLVGIPMNLSNDRHLKILKRFRVTPVSPGLLLSVQAAVQLSIAFLSLAIVYLVLHFGFGYKMAGSFPLFILSYLFVVVMIYSLGCMIASIAPDLKTATAICMIVYFPMMFLSGATIPYEVMPKALREGVDFLPLAQGIKFLKGISLGGGFEDVLFQIFVMIILSVAFIGISLKCFKWE